MRQRALRQAREWMFEHLERSEGLAAIYPAMMNAIFALVALGHSPDDPLLTARGKSTSFPGLRSRMWRHDPCCSLRFARFGTPRLQWLLSKKRDCRRIIRRSIESGQLAAQKANKRVRRLDVEDSRGDAGRVGCLSSAMISIRDVDDTAFVLMALQRVDYPDKGRMEASVRRGLAWLLAHAKPRRRAGARSITTTTPPVPVP